MNSENFLALAHSINISDPDTKEVWEGLLLSLKQGDSNPELILEMLSTLGGKSGRMGYDELSLDDDIDEGGTGDRAVLSYMGYSTEKLFCSKEKLLNAYNSLTKIIHV